MSNYQDLESTIQLLQALQGTTFAVKRMEMKANAMSEKWEIDVSLALDATVQDQKQVDELHEKEESSATWVDTADIQGGFEEALGSDIDGAIQELAKIAEEKSRTKGVERDTHSTDAENGFSEIDIRAEELLRDAGKPRLRGNPPKEKRKRGDLGGKRRSYKKKEEKEQESVMPLSIGNTPLPTFPRQPVEVTAHVPTTLLDTDFDDELEIE